MRLSTVIGRCSAWSRLPVAAAVLLAMLPLAAIQASEEDETRDARVGELFILKFPGNREGGYRWRLNTERSQGLDIVEVKEIGWTIKNNAGSIFFRELPVMSISVLPKAAGKARIAFDYYRTWGTGPYANPKTKTVHLRVLP